jgi:hypothetical protein
MRRNKKSHFKLNPDWMLSNRPLDFEYNKYILLNYIQKCEKGFNNFEIYPDFIELSLHLANIQSIYKEQKLLITKKKFESCDDEILLKDLVPVDTEKLTDEEEIELERTIKYSGDKLYQMFNTAKSIWSIAYDNVDIILRRNNSEVTSTSGYIFYLKKDTMTLYVWEYHDKRNKKSLENTKMRLKLIYEDQYGDKKISQIIEENTTFTKNQTYKDFPIFEAKSSGYFPMENTFVPIMKRKLTSYLYQISTVD